MGERCAPAATDRLAPTRCAMWPVARRRRRPDAEKFCGEVSFCTSLSLHITRSPRRRAIGLSTTGLPARSRAPWAGGGDKAQSLLRRNYLTGRDGDRINAVLAAAGYNFSLLLRWSAKLLAPSR